MVHLSAIVWLTCLTMVQGSVLNRQRVTRNPNSTSQVDTVGSRISFSGAIVQVADSGRTTIHVPLQTHTPGRRMLEETGPGRGWQEEQMWGSWKDNSKGYTCSLSVGTPFQTFEVIVDTGSDRLFLPCAGCTTCGDNQNLFDPSASSTASECPCDGTSCGGNCTFKISYMEGSTASGKLIQDKMCLSTPENCGASQLTDFSIGCATYESDKISARKVGMAGLSPASDFLHAIMLAHQAEHYDDIFSVCLGDEGGNLVLGGYNVPMNDPSREIVWVSQMTADKYPKTLAPLLGPYLNAYYWILATDLTVGSEAAAGSQWTGIIVDSGTSFSYLPATMISHITSSLTDLCTRDISLSCHYSSDNLVLFSTATRDDLAAKLPVITFSVISSSATSGSVDVEPIDYLVEVPKSLCPGSSSSSLCLFAGFLPVTTKVPLPILGMSAMRGKNVIFDRKKKLIGFVKADCTYSGRGARPCERYLTIHQIALCASLALLILTGLLYGWLQKNVLVLKVQTSADDSPSRISALKAITRLASGGLCSALFSLLSDVLLIFVDVTPGRQACGDSSLFSHGYWMVLVSLYAGSLHYRAWSLSGSETAAVNENDAPFELNAGQDTEMNAGQDTEVNAEMNAEQTAEMTAELNAEMKASQDTKPNADRHIELNAVFPRTPGSDSPSKAGVPSELETVLLEQEDRLYDSL